MISSHIYVYLVDGDKFESILAFRVGDIGSCFVRDPDSQCRYLGTENSGVAVGASEFSDYCKSALFEVVAVEQSF